MIFNILYGILFDTFREIIDINEYDKELLDELNKVPVHQHSIPHGTALGYRPTEDSDKWLAAASVRD